MIIKLTFKHIMSKPFSSFMTLVAVASALTVLGTFWTVVENLERVKVSQAQAQVQPEEQTPGVTLYLDSKLTATQVETLKAKLLEDKRFASAVVVSSTEAIKALEHQFGEAISKAFGNETLPIAMKLQYARSTLSRDELVSLKNSLQSQSGVLEVDDGTSLMTKEKSKLSSRVFSWSTGLFLIVFLLVALLVSHLIRLAFESSKSEIETMKVLGAKRGWMFLPLFFEGLFFGLVGAVLSLVVLTVGVKVLLPKISQSLIPQGVEFVSLSPASSLHLLLLGLAASVVGSILTWPLIDKPAREI